jgi:hypothetical protein
LIIVVSWEQAAPERHRGGCVPPMR